ncbi:MAG: hypothetical protein IPL32_01400 [Chloracidobacterium sp.]|nr:hypothetical protein [Chloracidobacterium sp.]
MKPFVYSSFLILLLFVGGTAQTSSASKEITKLCKRVKDIKQLPHDRGEKGVDSVYDQIFAAGESLTPCLIENITNTRIMKDPRCPTVSKATTVGDVSYFLLVRIEGFDFTKFLPTDIQEKYKTNGVYAYHEYIDRLGARTELREKLRVWYGEIHGID